MGAKGRTGSEGAGAVVVVVVVGVAAVDVLVVEGEPELAGEASGSDGSLVPEQLAASQPSTRAIATAEAGARVCGRI